jgi:nitric oxide reductase activation protein
MRIWNKKMRFPKPEENFTYTEEEADEIEQAKLHMQNCTDARRSANRAWKMWLNTTTVMPLPPIQVASKVAQVKHLRAQTRRLLHDSYVRYYDAVIPHRLRLQRIGKVVGVYIKDRLSEESFVEKILPVVSVTETSK